MCAELESWSVESSHFQLNWGPLNLLLLVLKASFLIGVKKENEEIWGKFLYFADEINPVNVMWAVHDVFSVRLNGQMGRKDYNCTILLIGELYLRTY